MPSRFWFDAEKALEVLLYVAQHTPDMYTILKTIYVADKKHLSRYGRLIADDWYCAMDYGPVGSNSYNMLKYVRGDRKRTFDPSVRKALKMQGKQTVIPLRAANTDFLSQSDIECLDAAIRECVDLEFGELADLVHDAAYKATRRNGRIPFERIIQTLPNAGLLLEYFEGI